VLSSRRVEKIFCMRKHYNVSILRWSDTAILPMAAIRPS
jgi:hypothetical protein